MASTYYDWHFARSQNRMKQNHLFDNGVQVEKYHHKDGLVLNFLAVASGKQFSVLLDKQHTLEVRNQILNFYPTDEVTRLRLAMTAITHNARNLLSHAESDYEMDNIQAILDAAGSWPKIQEQAIDVHALQDRVAILEKQVRDMKDAANQLVGIDGWIADKDMKRHCTNTLEKLTK